MYLYEYRREFQQTEENISKQEMYMFKIVICNNCLSCVQIRQQGKTERKICIKFINDPRAIC